MTSLKENHLEWALKHVMRYYSSDFYPRLFEFYAILHNWQNVKNHILAIDLDKYSPKSPLIYLAPKSQLTYRVVHQLDPIDSLIYTALIHEISEVVESFRIADSEKIACSYRIKPDLQGSFFEKPTGWNDFMTRSKELANKYEKGFVLLTDITDFYNQIYIHRIKNLIEEAGKGKFKDQARIIENFLSALNKTTSRGIPVGPAPSIILAELIMADIDNMIATHTKDFVRYVDDIRIFVEKEEHAIHLIHELSHYLYTNHRLVFSSEKTKLISTELFLEEYLTDEEETENTALMERAEDLAEVEFLKIAEDLPDYLDPYSFESQQYYDERLEYLLTEGKFELLATTYKELFEKSIHSYPVNYSLLRHLLRKATRYRIRNLIPVLLSNFEIFLPIIREAIIYLNKLMNERLANIYFSNFKTIFNAHYSRLPFVNLWMSYLLENECFKEVDFDFFECLTERAKALIACMKENKVWVKGYKDKVDVLGPWDRRAVIYSSQILSNDEMKYWTKAVSASGDILDESLAMYLASLTNAN